MAVLRLEAFRALEAAILASLPELRPSGDMKHLWIGQAPSTQKLCFPSLVIDPIRFKYIPHQEQEVFEPSPSTSVVNVGRHEATVQLRLAAATPFQRYELQDRILDLFLRSPLRPGVLLTPVTTCEALGQITASWELGDDEWQDEKAFDSQFWALTVIDGLIPALVTRTGTYRIEDLKLGLTHDMAAPITSATIGTSDAVDLVRINDDGTFTTL